MPRSLVTSRTHKAVRPASASWILMIADEGIVEFTESTSGRRNRLYHQMA